MHHSTKTVNVTINLLTASDNKLFVLWTILGMPLNTTQYDTAVLLWTRGTPCSFHRMNIERTGSVLIWLLVQHKSVVGWHFGAVGSTVQSSLRKFGVIFIRNYFFQQGNISKLRTLVSKLSWSWLLIPLLCLTWIIVTYSVFLNKKELDCLWAVQNSAATTSHSNPQS